MKEKILEDLTKRPGLMGKWDVLDDMVEDSMMDMRSFLNYRDNEELPQGCIPAIKELTLIRFNQDGAEGITSESQSSGGSTTYFHELPASVRRIIRHYRRLKR